MTETIHQEGEGFVVENEVLEMTVPMTPEELKMMMLKYRSEHPEQFSGTPEWKIRVSAEIAGQVYEETGIRFVPF